MNTAAEADAIATSTTSALLDDALEQIKSAIELAAKREYDTLATRLTADIRAHVTNYVTQRLDGHTQFNLTYPDVCNKPLPVIKDIVYLVDEVPFVWHQPDANYSAHIVTNYGRYIVGFGQHHPPGQRLPSNVIKCIRASIVAYGRSDSTYSSVIAALKAIDVIDSNTVHAARVIECKIQARAEFDDERAKCAATVAERNAKLDERRAELDAYYVKCMKRRDQNIADARLNEAQAALNTRDREELERDIAASEAHKKSHADLKTAHRQAALVRAQLAKQATQLNEREAALGRERKRLDAIEATLDERADALGIDLTDVVFD